MKNAANGDWKADWPTWLMVGATGFGGPAGQIAILHREVVERRQWLDEEEFLAALKVCMLLPGPEAQQLATYAGWRRGGLPGGLVAGTLFVLPGAVLVTALAWLHAAGGSWPLVAAAFAGTRPAVVALVALAAWRIGRKSLTSPTAVVVMLAALAALAGGIAFPVVVVAAGIIGIVLPGKVAAAPASSDASTRPSGGRSSAFRHVVAVATTATVVWAVCYGLVSATSVAGGRGAAVARLFTTTTLLSLGGAYAVVPWALDESVARGWLDADERFTALAMGEATPGPLILVVTFIGFMAGWKAAPAAALSAGFEGAAVATLFAFLPSFAMIFGLAPFVQSIHPRSWLGRAMTAVGAAVVAAIVLLAMKLAVAAFLPGGSVDLLAVVVAVGSAAALLAGRASTPVVVAAAAAIGVLASLVR
ncbi:MAG: chromate efflux transporter [Planctomycetia bacterium]